MEWDWMFCVLSILIIDKINTKIGFEFISIRTSNHLDNGLNILGLNCKWTLAL